MNPSFGSWGARVKVFRAGRSVRQLTNHKYLELYRVQYSVQHCTQPNSNWLGWLAALTTSFSFVFFEDYELWFDLYTFRVRSESILYSGNASLFRSAWEHCNKMRNEEIRRRLCERHAHLVKPIMLHKAEEQTTGNKDRRHEQHLATHEQNWNDANVLSRSKLQVMRDQFTSARISKHHMLSQELLSLTANTSVSADEENPGEAYNRTGVSTQTHHSLNSQECVDEEKKSRMYSSRPPPGVLDTSQESFPTGAILRTQTFLPINFSNRSHLMPANEFRIPLGSTPDESLELSAIGAEISRIADRSFDLDDDMPDDERNASTAEKQNNNGGGEDDHFSSQEYVMVSKNYVEVCLLSSFENTREKSCKHKKSSPSIAMDSSMDLFDELRNGGLPFVVRKFHEELDEIKADFRSLGEDIAETAAEVRNQNYSFMADVFVSRDKAVV